MSTVSTYKKMNWFKKPSAWQAMEAQRARRRQMVADFQERSAALAAGFSKASAIQIEGVGQIAAQTVQSRLQARARELSAEFEDRVARFDKLV